MSHNRSKKIEVLCIGCDKIREYRVYKENSSRITEYCSKKCYANHQKERLSQQLKQNALSPEIISRMQKERFANKENHPFYGKKHKESTKQKISENAIRRYRNPENNPMYGRSHTEKTKQKMSEVVSRQFIEGLRDVKNAAYEQGWFLSKKTKTKIFFRSSWEKRYLEYLDGNNNHVLNFCSPDIRIPYRNTDGNLRYYLPDFLIDGKELIEIKPSSHLKYEKNKLKFGAARKYCERNNLKFRVLTERYLRRLGLDV